MVRRRKKNRCRGLATVEAALVFPILLVLTLGAIHYGWLFLKLQYMTNAARYGARVAIRPDSLPDVDVIPTVRSLLSKGGIDPNLCTINVNTVGDPNDVGVPIEVEIIIEDPNSIVLFAIPELLPIPNRLRSAVTMAKEGF